MDLSVVPYSKQSNMKTDNESEDGDIVEPNKTATHKKLAALAADAVKYRECMRNHAASIGGHANDGCGEFMPADSPPLTCAACGCHRNFHRRDADVRGLPSYNIVPYNPHFNSHGNYRGPAGFLQVRPLALPSTSGGDEELSELAAPGSGGKKRFRTKFTAEQKERMLALAERLGWRIQKQDEPLVQEFCSEAGVRRHVLKVWMHNNKHTLGKKP